MFSFLHRIFIFMSKFLSRRNLYALIETFCANRDLGKVLFVGSGGELEVFVRNFQYSSITTIDIQLERNPDILMDAKDLKFDDNSFDTIFILEVLEHINEPHLAVEEVLRTLKPNGNTVLSTPFVFGLHDAPHDYFRFTKFGIDYLFRNFEKISLKPRTGFFWTIVVLMARLIMAKNRYHKIIAIPVILFGVILSPIIYFVDYVMPDDITTGYVAIYKKPQIGR